MLTIWNFEGTVSMSLFRIGRTTPIKPMPFIRPRLPLPHSQTNLFPPKNFTLPICLVLSWSELEAVVCANFLQQPLLIWAIADGSQLHPLINYSPTARIFTQTIIHISYSGLHYNALIHDSDQTSLLLSQQVSFNSINNPTHAATPSCHSHPTGPSHTSHSEHPPCTSDRRHFVPPKRPTNAKALKSCAHDKISPRASRPLVPDSTRRQRPPSIHPQRTRRQKLTISTHAFTCRSTKSPDP
jgi:hypothetical protein